MCFDAMLVNQTLVILRTNKILLKVKNSSSFNFDVRWNLSNFFCCVFCEYLLTKYGDIEKNLDLTKKLKVCTCCHWNVNSLTAHNILKNSSIKAYNPKG